MVNGKDTQIDDFISVSIVARMRKYLYPLTERHVRRMCEAGVFKTAYKPGMGKRGTWLISASEIIQHKINRHAQP